MKLVDTLAEQEIVEALIEATKPPVPRRMRGRSLPALDAVSLCALPKRLSLPPRRPYPRRLLCGGRAAHGRRRNGLLSAPVLRRIARHPVASQPPRMHRLLGRGPLSPLARPHHTASRRRRAPSGATRSNTALARTSPTRRAKPARKSCATPPRAHPGVCVAVLVCGAFAEASPKGRETWRIGVGQSGAYALREFPEARLEFGRDAFAADPRIAAMQWER